MQHTQIAKLAICVSNVKTAYKHVYHREEHVCNELKMATVKWNINTVGLFCIMQRSQLSTYQQYSITIEIVNHHPQCHSQTFGDAWA